jgi:transposase
MMPGVGVPGTMRCYLEAYAPRVACPRHRVVVAAVPWARPGSRFTAAFEDQTAWLCANMTGTRAAQLLRTTWRSVPAIVERAVAELAGKTDRLAGLARMAIDEISYRKGRRFLMIVVDRPVRPGVGSARRETSSASCAARAHPRPRNHPVAADE